MDGSTRAGRHWRALAEDDYYRALGAGVFIDRELVDDAVLSVYAALCRERRADRRDGAAVLPRYELLGAAIQICMPGAG